MTFVCSSFRLFVLGFVASIADDASRDHLEFVDQECDLSVDLDVSLLQIDLQSKLNDFENEFRRRTAEVEAVPESRVHQVLPTAFSPVGENSLSLSSEVQATCDPGCTSTESGCSCPELMPTPLERASEPVAPRQTQGSFPMDECTPQCTWQCSTPKCNEVCAPKCKAPVCETRCPSTPDLSQCMFECDKPECSVACPEETCPNFGCPSCTASCSEPHCKLKCSGEQHCSTVCEQPDCEWECRAPEDCPAPQCQMVCEQPKACMGSTYRQMPPLQPGETSVQSVRASVALLQLAKNETDMLHVEATSMPPHPLPTLHPERHRELPPRPRRHVLAYPVRNALRSLGHP